MINLLCKLIATIIFTGINGTILIVPIIMLVKLIYEQTRQLIKTFKEV